MSADTDHKYTMRLSLNVLKHLGLNLYSNIPAVISELVANAYDADAKRVEITIDEEKEVVTIRDNGHGMTLTDINDKFLNVGYARRENNEGYSHELKRPVMGRKGIGKLSIFSIANNVEIHTIKEEEKNGLILNRWKIEEEILENNEYHPEDVPDNQFKIDKGTRLILTDFKKKINYTPSYLRKRLARRFSVIGQTNQFEIVVNNKQIAVEDRDYFSKIQFIWFVGDADEEITKRFEFDNIEQLPSMIDGPENYQISGWIGAVEKPSHLNQDNVNNNKVSILCRGKMAQEDILESFSEGGIYFDYLIGEINADFLDVDENEDIATSSRQKINEEDPRYKLLQDHIYKILKKIQGVWTDLRREYSKKVAIDKAEEISPAIKDWFETIKSDSEKTHALELFSTIDNLHFDKEEEKTKKKELYKHGILAFEKLKLRRSLDELKSIQSAEDVRLASIFSDLTDLEANMYFDIAYERVEVIKKFQAHLDANDKEKLLQKYLFDHLWLLNPSWERPTEGTELMEQRVETEFGVVVDSLSDEEKAARLDIKYRTAGGKHIIIELKRYQPTYTITPIKLYEQVAKYKSALEKCLDAIQEQNPHIEIIVILGQPLNDVDYKEAERLLSGIGGRIIYYDRLIEDSLKAYSDYLVKQREVSRLRELIDKI